MAKRRDPKEAAPQVRFQSIQKPEAAPVMQPTKPARNPQLDALREEMASLKEAFEKSETMVAQHLATLTENLDDVHTLSELLSVRYNPFLDDAEPAVFDDVARRDVASLLQSIRRPDETAPAKPKPNMPSWDELPPPSPEDLGDPVPVHDVSRHPWPDHDRRRPAPEAGKPTRDHEPLKVDVPRTMAESHSFIGAPRPTFMALSWIDELQEKMPPEAIFLCLDYYRDIGWLEQSAYDWLCVLAAGSVDRDPHATWSNLGLSPRRLTSVHQANLVFLNNLFNERLGPEERRTLRNQVRNDFGDL